MPTLMPKPAASWARVSCLRGYIQSDDRALRRPELAPAITLTGDNQHGDPLHQGMGHVQCGRIDNQRGSPAIELRLQTHHLSHPSGGHSEKAHYLQLECCRTTRTCGKRSDSTRPPAPSVEPSSITDDFDRVTPEGMSWISGESLIASSGPIALASLT